MPELEMLKLACGPDGTRRPGEIFTATQEEAKALVDDNAARVISKAEKAEAKESRGQKK